MPEHRKHLLILAEYQRVSSTKKGAHQLNEESLGKESDDAAQKTLVNKPNQQ